MTSIFSPQQLSQIVSQTIPAATDETHHDAIVGTVDTTGAQVVVHFERKSPSDAWELDADGVARHNWNGDNQVGAQVILKF